MSMGTNAEFNEGMPIGSLVEYAGTTAPTNWVLCQGQALSRTDYAELFEIIGTTYGTGNGSTTFNVPDMRDRIAIGKTSSGTLGAKAGSKTNNLTITVPLPKHTHTVPAKGISWDAVVPDTSPYHANPTTAGNTNALSYGPKTSNGLTGDLSGTITTSQAGTGNKVSTGNFSIMPPTIALNYIMKVK